MTPDDVARAAEIIRGPAAPDAGVQRALDPRGALPEGRALQRTGSFKPRGVLTNLAALGPEERARGVISVSAGNHAQALAWGAAQEGIDALLVMWRDASEAKVAATRAYGAAVDLEADGPGAAFARLEELIADDGAGVRAPVRRSGHDRGPGNGGLEILEDPEASTRSSSRAAEGGSCSGIAVACVPAGVRWWRSSPWALRPCTRGSPPASPCP